MGGAAEAANRIACWATWTLPTCRTRSTLPRCNPASGAAAPTTVAALATEVPPATEVAPATAAPAVAATTAVCVQRYDDGPADDDGSDGWLWGLRRLRRWRHGHGLQRPRIRIRRPAILGSARRWRRRLFIPMDL